MAPNASISSIILPPRKKLPVHLPARKKIVVPHPVRKVYYNPSSIINHEHFAEISSCIDRH
ncbi:25412_t:CDS:2 [Gigaspora rosea]|nr:25412_t:CDS:2 [Gigaspora rosea]